MLLRVVALFRYRFDSDEQQHLHVTWGWTAGLVQYRDVFDNHPPLFHLLTAPLLALLGERAEILLWMRLPMLLLFGLVLWATWSVARAVFDERVASWALLLLTLFPPFFLKSLEYRADNLWNAFWMSALVLLIRRERPFWTGLLLGCALATSLKTSLLLIGLCGGLLLAKLLRVPLPPLMQRGVKAWLAAVAGILVVPAVLSAGFVAAGAWDELVYCNVAFNANLTGLRRHLWIGKAMFPFATAALVWAAWKTRRTPTPWRWFLAVVMGVYVVTIAGFWPLISPRDFLPLMPLAAIFAAAILIRLERPLAWLGGTAALFTLALVYYADRFENRTDWHITMMNQTLRLTRPGERLIDYKGETIYRRRPFYYAFEIVTRTQMAAGLIPDTVAQDVIRTRTYAAQADGAMWPPAARAFLSDHFLNLGRLRAAGQWIRPDGSFTIAIPGEYVVLTARGEAAGRLNGTPHNGPRMLEAGTHRFEGEEGAAVLWAPAFRRGHSPFHLRDTEF